VDIFARWKVHSNLAAKKKKSAIQNAFVLYGIDKFSFEVVEECDKEMMNDREVHWIAYFNSVSPNGYNLTSGGGQGVTVSDETKAKQSAMRKGKKRGPQSEETKAKRSAGNKGKKRSDETKAKISAVRKGKKRPQPQGQCPHCSKVGGIYTMKRWHFENCKIYNELGVPKLGEEDGI
jgi:group I intron endonuclease